MHPLVAVAHFATQHDVDGLVMSAAHSFNLCWACELACRQFRMFGVRARAFRVGVSWKK